MTKKFVLFRNMPQQGEHLLGHRFIYQQYYIGGLFENKQQYSLSMT